MTKLADWCRANPDLAAMEIERKTEALKAFVVAYGSQESSTGGLDKARDLAKAAIRAD